MINLYGYPLLAVGLVGSAAILLVTELGWQLGVRGDGRGGSNIATLESAILGLLALIIGFTFAMALSRFEARRDALLNEANSIGTAALRARLLPEPHRTETLKLLREYVQIRIDIAQSGRSLAELKVAIDRSNSLQERLWQQAIGVSKTNKDWVPGGAFIQTLNEMIDNQGKRLGVLRNQIPGVVLLALYVLASIATGFAGYASSLETKRSRLPVYIASILIAAVVYVILDLDRPSSGFIRNDQQPMIDAAATMANFSD
jgi:hypothetical protein